MQKEDSDNKYGSFFFKRHTSVFEEIRKGTNAPEKWFLRGGGGGYKARGKIESQMKVF